jgi:hypothetical protein
MTALSTKSEGGGAARDAVTHVLALESRNALARVELAASELARFDANPAMQEMLETIGDAVGELDVLLAKIGLLWSPGSGRQARSIEVDEVMSRVVERLGPALDARGVRVRAESGAGVCSLSLAASAFERLLLAFLRLGLLACERGESLTLETRRESEEIAIALGRTEGDSKGGPLPLDPAHRFELEVALAECGGRLTIAQETGELCFRLPEGARDG